MVHSFYRVRKSCRNSATDGSTAGSRPAPTRLRFLGELEVLQGSGLSRCALVLTTATGFSILKVCGGMMCRPACLPLD